MDSMRRRISFTKLGRFARGTRESPKDIDARRVALVAWSLPKCPSSAGASKRPRVLRRVASGDAYPGLMGTLRSQKYWVNTLSGLRPPDRSGQIDSKGGGSIPNCSRITLA